MWLVDPDIVVYGDTVENYEFLTVNGAWDLVATSNTLDQPFVFTLAPGDPANPRRGCIGRPVANR